MSIGLYAADLYVSGSNPTNGNGTSSNPYRYISSAISLAHNNNQNNVIYIAGMAPGTPDSLLYKQNLTISGFQHDLTMKPWDISTDEVILLGSGTSASTIHISNNTSTIKLEDITVVRTLNPSGSSQLQGGGISIAGSELTIIENCVIHDCRALKGGGLYASDSNVQILGSKLYNNTGLSSSGIVVTSYGGAIYSEYSDIYISNTIFYNNGEGVANCAETIFADYGSLTCESSTIIHDSPYAVSVTKYHLAYT